MKDYDGIEKPVPLDVDPQVLFEISLQTTENRISKTYILMDQAEAINKVRQYRDLLKDHFQLE
jgi:hypothetical protein